MAARLGLYCSFCERRILTNLAVEHIQPKALPAYARLKGRWENFLLCCVNCNSTKGAKDVVLDELLLPDRDNTFLAFEYAKDGTVAATSALANPARTMAANTLKLVGLDRRAADATDANGRLVALDRVKQRMEAWVMAESARDDVVQNPGNEAVRRLTAVLAVQSGFFSIWMKVFENDVDMRNRLIDSFAGTRNSACFDPSTSAAVHPAPNPDGLVHGGKT